MISIQQKQLNTMQTEGYGEEIVKHEIFEKSKQK